MTSTALIRRRRSVDQLAAIVEDSDDAIISKSLDGTILSWNAAAESMYGYTADEAIGQPVSIIVPPDRAGELARITERLRRGERVDHLETVRLHKDGLTSDVSVTISPIVDATGAVVGASSIARDIGGRPDHSAEALHKSEESYRRLFERQPSPACIFDPETLCFLAVNEAAIASYGYSREEFLTMTVDEIQPDESAARLREALADLHDGSRVAPSIWRHRRKDGVAIEASIATSLVEFEGRSAWLVLAQDVTERRRLEEQLLQSQKVEAIGTLAGGVAHDFNNVLMVVRASAALLLKDLTDPQQRADALQIDAAAQRGAELTRQLLAFSRQQVLHLQASDVNEVVADTLGLLDRVIGEDIETISELEPGLPSVVVDRAQLGQVILNLAVNARDAMPNGGALSILTAAVELDETYAAAHPGVVAGPYVLLEVTDSGAGMDDETRVRAFDPFFTTKPTGTGLGLATVYGIVSQSGGHIDLSSEPGSGTTFTLYFPSVSVPVAPAEEVPLKVISLDGDETILLVEDNDAVRPVVAEALREYGYSVLEARSGAEAIQIASEIGDQIDLLFTDIVMSGMNGRELAERLTGKQPDLRVLYTSGYPADAFVRRDIEGGRAAYIEKPYAPDELAVRIREALV